MKKIVYLVLLPFSLFILLLSTSPVAHAQEGNSSFIGKYFWKNVILMEEVDIKGASKTPKTYLLSIPKQSFRVVDVLDNGVLIQILYYPETSANFYKYNFSDKSKYSNLDDSQRKSYDFGTEQKYFRVTIEQLEKHAVRNGYISGSLAFGIINFPFKFRRQKDKRDFSGGFNFGAAIGYKIPHKESRKATYSLITGYSISNVVLDEVSVDRNADKLAETNNFSAFSFSIGGLVEYNKVQAGLFIGWDNISRINQSTYGWHYQGKPWISVGFGYSIFSSEKEGSTEGNTQP